MIGAWGTRAPNIRLATTLGMPLALLLAGCGMDLLRRGPTVPAPRLDLPICGPTAESISELTSFRDLSTPSSQWVDMVYNREVKGWSPAEALPMYPHHATRIELQNSDAFPALAHYQTSRLRFTLALADPTRVADRRRRTVRATYPARILTVCVVLPTEAESLTP